MIRFEKTHPGVPDPVRAHPTDAGMDLTAQIEDEAITIDAMESALVGTGIKVAIPPGHVGLVVVRSSLGIKRRIGLANDVGIIDSDYRGEIKLALQNRSPGKQTINRGERVAQLIITPISLDPWQEAPLDTTERGTGGFGSTGD